jgi:hypothetical protein
VPLEMRGITLSMVSGCNAAELSRLGYAGVSQTFRAMRQLYHWPGMKLDVSAYVAQCHPCQLKRLATEEVASLRPPKMAEPLEHIHVDLAGPFPIHGGAPRTTKGSSSRTPSRGHAYICLIVDYFTKATEFVAIPNKSAATVAQAFMAFGLCAVAYPRSSLIMVHSKVPSSVCSHTAVSVMSTRSKSDQVKKSPKSQIIDLESYQRTNIAKAYLD